MTYVFFDGFYLKNLNTFNDLRTGIVDHVQCRFKTNHQRPDRIEKRTEDQVVSGGVVVNSEPLYSKDLLHQRFQDSKVANWKVKNGFHLPIATN